ncbi:MAG: hypothetical protein AAF497_10180 [Planctomycetota bacterium]
MRFRSLFLLILAVLGFAGWSIPWQFRSAALQQSSTPEEWAQLGRLVVGTWIVAPVLALATWGYRKWRAAAKSEPGPSPTEPDATQLRERQFSLRSALAATTLVAFAMAILRFWQSQTSASVTSVWAGWIFASGISAVAMYSLPAKSETEVLNESKVAGQNNSRGWPLLLGLVAIAAALATLIFFTIEKPASLMICVWLVLFMVSVWIFARQTFPKTLVLLGVLYLPFIWLIPYGYRHRDLGEVMELLFFLPITPGIAPGALIFRGGPDNTVAPASCVVALCLISWLIARWGNRFVIAAYVAVVSFLGLCCAFGIHAMFRA